MLADRAYEPAWPLIEAHVGKNLETATDGFVALTAEKLSRNPADTSWLNFHMMALLGAGRDEEAAERTGKLLAEKTANGVINEQDAWALDFQTKALMALGRNDEANAVYDRLVTPRQDSWMVNFSINRAAALLRQRRWAAALDAFKIARKHADQHGTTYARILVARGTGLALYKLGRVSEVGTEANYLIRNAEGYLPFVLDGLLCVGRREDAERIAKSAVRRGDVSGQFVEQIQDTRFDITDVPDMSGEAPICPSMREFILASDELREPILKKVRLLPDHLIPIGQIRRQERLSASTRSL
jgi:tetratricopeptide (TPR) repeat protein